MRWTVPVAVPGPRVVIPAGRTRLTTRVTSLVAPVRSSVAVSIAASVRSASASPWTVTAAGLTLTVLTWKPLLGAPLIWAATGTVRVCWAPTRIWTRIVWGSMATGLRALLRASTAISGTSWSTSRPDGWITTRAIAAVARLTTEAGPETTTELADRTGVWGCSPATGAPSSTLTGTLLEISGSSWTWTTWGSKSRIWTRGSAAWTWTCTVENGVPARGVAVDRSTVAVK